MATIPFVPVVEETEASLVAPSAAEIELDDFQAARRDPHIKALLKDAAAEGARVEREGRNRW